MKALFKLGTSSELRRAGRLYSNAIC
ncbi:hypothetical protein RSAG8_00980, partial [Rhizoctonia solani AG-8 WAC10335]